MVKRMDYLIDILRILIFFFDILKFSFQIHTTKGELLPRFKYF